MDDYGSAMFGALVGLLVYIAVMAYQIDAKLDALTEIHQQAGQTGP